MRRNQSSLIDMFSIFGDAWVKCSEIDKQALCICCLFIQFMAPTCHSHYYSFYYLIYRCCPPRCCLPRCSLDDEEEEDDEEEKVIALTTFRKRYFAS